MFWLCYFLGETMARKSQGKLVQLPGAGTGMLKTGEAPLSRSKNWPICVQRVNSCYYQQPINIYYCKDCHLDSLASQEIYLRAILFLELGRASNKRLRSWLFGVLAFQFLPVFTPAERLLQPRSFVRLVRGCNESRWRPCQPQCLVLQLLRIRRSNTEKSVSDRLPHLHSEGQRRGEYVDCTPPLKASTSQTWSCFANGKTRLASGDFVTPRQKFNEPGGFLE